MKVFLMYSDRDFDSSAPGPWNEAELTADLELGVLWQAMAGEDEFLKQVARAALLAGCHDIEQLGYRQAVVRDCLQNPDVIRKLYDLALAAQEVRKGMYWGVSHYVGAILGSSIEALQKYAVLLRQLRDVADQSAGRFASEGLRRFFAMLQSDLSDAYFETIDAHLKALRFRHGVLISARLGQGNKGQDYTLHLPREAGHLSLTHLFQKKPAAYSYRLPPRDEMGARALSELHGQGVNLVANALAQSTEHILGFMNVLRTELAFFVACLNLHDRLQALGAPSVLPVVAPVAPAMRSFQGLYDICLALQTGRPVVGNDLQADGKNLVVITGANQGGKSTFLRSIGVSQLMLECGMFVPAQACAANLSTSLITHYKREEDTSMHSGKLDEELARMSQIVDHLQPGCLVLFNESFAATNEREGADIAWTITHALLSHGVRVFAVTHLYEYAARFYQEQRDDAIYLRAPRAPDGSRTFRLEVASPLATSYGADLYQKIFGDEDIDLARRT
ncbi:DNA mismatch repair protein MutS [Castellaniella caeni]